MEGIEELEEEEVWSVLRERETSDPEMKIFKSNNLFSDSSSSARYIPIPKANKVTAGAKKSSAPMNIPDWSKVYGYSKKNNASCHLHSWAIDDYNDDEGYRVPPHEVIAKRLLRMQISCFSMCEGIGRTLKGRDLIKTRNAVLTRTGFLESSIRSSNTTALVMRWHGG